MKLITPNSLCERCQKFRLERLFSGTNTEETKSTTEDTKPYYNELIPGGCELCEFFMECLPERCKLRSADGSWFICMNSVSDSELREPAKVGAWCYPPVKQGESLGCLWMVISSDKILMGAANIEVSPFVCIPTERLQTYELPAPPPNLDLAPISDWLNKERRTKQARWYPEKNSASLALTVIDCTTHTLVPLLSGELYATLSYVWGPSIQPPLDGVNSHQLPLRLPNTIQDSIDVCNKLSIRYLWVDRYCISHQNDHLRSLQISRMDEVYHNSFLTIVACAGEDPEYGLPGVSRQRNSDPSIELVGLGCIQTLSQSIEIHSGIWATRAWTYQEALLSRRQLYFTNKETFFGSADGIQGERDTVSQGYLEQFLPEHMRTGCSVPGTLRDNYERRYLLGRLHIWECIFEYSTRTLSFQTDILNALLGILAHYGRQHGIRHLWGMPFSASAQVTSPPEALSLEMSLRWIVKGPSCRREGFPSWSWTGCNGQVLHVEARPESKPEVTMTEETAICIEIELISGRLLKWSDYQDNYANLQDYNLAHSSHGNADRPSRFIHLEAFTSRITKKCWDSRDVQYYSIDATTLAGEPEYFGSMERQAYANSNVAIVETFPVGSLLALHFLQVDSKRWRGGFFGQLHSFWNNGCALLIRNEGDYWERVCLLGSERSLKSGHVPKVRRKIRLG